MSPARRKRATHLKSRLRLFESLESRLLMNADWHNPARPTDVDNDLVISPLDALIVVNRLNDPRLPSQLGARTNRLDFYYDTNADSQASPIDALLVIDQLNSATSPSDLTPARQEGESEGVPVGFVSLFFARLPGDGRQIVDLSTQINIGREQFNEMGLFVVESPEGEVEGFLPGSAGYEEAVFNSPFRKVLYSRLDIEREGQDVTMPAGSYVGVYVLQGASDSDVSVDHLRVTQTGTFRHQIGWEEHAASAPWSGVGNREYDDVLVDVRIGEPRNGESEPVIAPITNQSVNELNEFVYQVAVTDENLPNDSLTYTLDNRPAGMTIDPVLGRIVWTPTEAQGPGVYNVLVRVTDSTGLFDLESFTIAVSEANPTSDFILREQDRFVTQQSVDISLGQTEGTRTLSFSVMASFDESSGASALADQFAVYLVDPENPSQTLLDRGTPGTSLFVYSEGKADYAPGLVTFNGEIVTLDLTSLGQRTAGRLIFQLLNLDQDDGTLVRVRNFVSTLNPNALARPAFDDLAVARAPSGVEDLIAFSTANGVELRVRNARFDFQTGIFAADVSLAATSGSTGRRIVAAFDGLPDDVELTNASGLDSSGRPYISFRDAIPAGGLREGEESAPVRVEYLNPNLRRFVTTAIVSSGGGNTAPVLPELSGLTVTPGGVLRIPLPSRDADGDLLTYRLESATELPPGRLGAALEFAPSPTDIGSYSFTLIAFDGAVESRRDGMLVVAADADTSTRVSGWVLDVDQTPLVGITVEMGSIQAMTDSQGKFEVQLGATPPATDTLRVRGDLFSGTNVYPFIAEKLPLLLEHDLYLGANNVIARPIYLPRLDMTNAVPIDPSRTTVVTTAAIPGASVTVQAGTLLNQQSTLFTGRMSITQVPPELTPAALPDNLRPDMVLTIQPGEMVFTTPARLTFPNSANYPVGTRLDLWSINPVTGQFDDVGDMEVQSDASAPGGSIIRTISGGIRNSSWHFPAPPPPNPNPDDDGDEDDDCDECKATDGNFEVEAHSGAVLDDHSFVTYQSLGRTQGFALHYDSDRADPRPIVHLSYSNLLPRNDQRLVATLTFIRDGVEYQVPGYDGDEFGGLAGGEHFWKLDVTGTGRVALQADLTEFESGVYSYEIASGPMQFDGSRFTGTLRTQTKQLKLVNSTASPFGAGWGLNGLIQLVENDDGSVLWIDGGGSELAFGPATAAGQPLQSPPGDFSRLLKRPNGTYQQTMPDQAVYSFDDRHRIESKTDRNGNVWTYAYGAEGNLERVTDPTGLATRFLSLNGRIVEIIDPANRSTKLEYDAAGNLTKIVDPDGSAKSWDYDPSHRIVSETDKRGNQETMQYDFAGRAARSTRADGTELFYDPVQTQVLRPVEQTSHPLTAPSVSSLLQIKSQFVDANGNVTERRLDKQGQAVSTVDAEGARLAVGRNSENLVTRTTDGRGNVASFGYDARGNVSTVRDTITQTGSTGLSNQGTDFWLSFQQNNTSAATKTLFLSSPTATTGNVSIPGLSFSQDFSVEPGSVTTIVLPLTVATTASNQIVNRGIHIVSEAPVAVVGLNQLSATTDAFLGLPVDVIGQEYLVMSSRNGLVNGTHFAVVGTQDNTEVTIVPSVTTSGRAAGTPFTINLNAGQVYYLQNTNANADLTGSSISANAPVAAFSGHQCGNIPSNVSACDHMVEQLTPVETWGTAFATAPLATRRNGDTYRILASADDTDITINGAVVATLDRGQFFETRLTTSSAIIGTKPILVAQFSNGSSFDGIVSDPFMQLIPPVEQYDNNYTVATPSQGFISHFINITIPTIGAATVTLDGQTLAANLFTPIAGTEFSTAQIPVAAGIHSASSPIPFGMYLYGFGSFDSYGVLGGQRFSPGSQRSYTYDEVFNQLVLFQDDQGRTTKYDIDPATGNTTTSRRVVGEIDTIENGETNDLLTSYTYTTFGLVNTVTDPLGRVTDYDYDAQGRLIRATHALGTIDQSVLTYEYDVAGNQTAKIDGNGQRTSYDYDLLNRVVRITEADPDGAGPLASPVTTFVYDTAGNVVSTTNANGATTTSQYDALNRLIESTGPDPDGSGPQLAPVTTYAYDPSGNLQRLVDPNGNATSYEYDGRNRRSAMIDPDGGVTRFAYDTDDNLVQVVDPVGNVTRFRYDARNRLSEEIDPLGNSLRYEYDSTDNLVRKIDRNGRETRFAYDDLHRLVREEWIGDNDQVVNTIQYTYDAVGNLLAVADAFSALTYTYDARNRPLTVDNQGTPEAPRVVLSYAYDDNSNVISMSDTIEGAAGATTSYAYDALDRLVVLTQSGSAVSDKRVNFTYNAIGQYEAIDRYRDLAGTQLVIGTDYSYDSQNRLTRIDHLNAVDESVAFFDYEYDVASRITRIADRNGPTTYAYDDRDQLILADHADAAFADESYSYDPNGNRVSSHLHGSEYETGTANRLLSDGVYDYEYDFEGNMARRTEIATGAYRVFEWDHRNRLVKVEDFKADDSLQQSAMHLFDTLDRRITLIQSIKIDQNYRTSTRQLVYTREDIVFESVTEGTNTELHRNIHGPGVDELLLIESEPEELSWLLADHLGSTRATVDNQGETVFSQDTSSYGTSLDTSSTTIRNLFTGREFDETTGLYYYRKRFYDSHIGRFISEDPGRLSTGDINLFRYVGNSPTHFVDPNGLETTLITTYDYGIGSHSAVHVSTPGQPDFLYDPGGSYGDGKRGSGGFFEGSEADLNNYIKYQKDTGSTVETKKLNTSPDEEKKIRERAEELGDTGPFTCASSVSSTLDGICGIKPTSRPGKIPDMINCLDNNK
ncbi:MAG: RHS repeat-associated core domain-containing protein [Pirellulales bacterium]